MSITVADRDIELDDREVRVIGCLIEKELSTPDYYPMTINALTSACNQKTNRDPVVAYSETDVAEALDSLQRKRLVGSASSSYGRAAKFRHALAEMIGLGKRELAVLASLMLRGAETAGEIRARTGRMHSFDSLESVDAVLEELSKRDEPLVRQLARRPGQKETRFVHLMSADPGADDEAQPAEDTGDERIVALEHEVAQLKASLTNLEEEFRSFKEQFE